MDKNLLVGNDGNDNLLAGKGNDILMGGAGNDRLDGGSGADELSGGSGNDTYMVNAENATKRIIDADRSGTVTVRYAESGKQSELMLSGDYLLTSASTWSSQNGTVTLSNSAGLYRAVVNKGGFSTIIEFGPNFDPAAQGEDSDDFIDVGEGKDMVFAGWGRDTVWLGAGDDIAFGQGGVDAMHGDAGNDLIYGDGDLNFHDYPFFTVSYADIALHGDDVIDGGEGNDTIYGGGGADVIFGGADDDVISADGQQFLDDALNIPIAAQGNDYADGGQGNDTLFGFAGADTLLGGEGADYLYGDYSALGVAYHGADSLDGGDGDDHLFGQGGIDTLVGGAGSNVLSGGDGQDTLIATGIGDLLDGGSGIDVLRVSSGASVEIAATTLAGADADTLVLEGDLTSEAVSIALNTSYSASSQSATLTFAGSGTLIRLSSGVEGSVLGRSVQSVAFADGTTWTTAELQNHLHGIATEGNDSIYAFNGENSSLGGLAGNDTFYGGNGNDTFHGGEGKDLMYGQDGDDTLMGEAGANEMYGGEGADSYWGGGNNDGMRDNSVSSNDIYHWDSGSGCDIIDDMGGLDRLDVGSGIAQGAVRALQEGGIVKLAVSDSTRITIGNVQVSGALDLQRFVETIRFSDGYEWDIPRIKQELLRSTAAGDRLYGFETDDVIDGGAGNDIIDGMYGNDTLYGGSGDDILWDASVNEVMYGGAGNDSLHGGSGNDVMYGGAGNDSLEGGAGDDVFNFDLGDASDVVSGGDGLDRIEFGAGITESSFSSIRNIDGDLTLTLASGDKIRVEGVFDMYGALSNGSMVVESYHFETDTVWDPAALAVEALRQALIATSGNDLSYLSDAADAMDGGDGNDSLHGLGGGDTLIGSNGADSLYGGFGNDNLQGGIGNDVLQGDDDDDVLGGGDGADTLDGGYGNDRLDGGAGADTMVDGAGNDTYVVDNIGDSIAEYATATVDSVESSIAWTLGENLENLTLTGTSSISGSGNALANILTGNAGANRHYGGAGADTMIGGMGDDSYVIDSVGDTASEIASAGTDTVESSITWALGANFENLSLTGASAINGTGNTPSNTLRGSVGDNVLNGAAGADSLIGGAGNDTYVVDTAADVVTELAGEGVDTVQSAVSWTLGAEFENLTLAGSSIIDGTGNALDNTLTGNSAVNVLDGAAGSDLLDGRAGADTMIGGAGNDSYVVDDIGDSVVEAGNAGTDAVEASITWVLSGAVENLTLTGTLAVDGTGNALVNTLRGNSGDNTLNGGGEDDTLIGGAGNDTFLVNVATDVVTELAGEGVDTVKSAVTWVLGAELENLSLTGTAATDGTGNSLNNSMTGNSAANRLDGGAGNDVLNGGAGGDVLIGGAGNDTFVVDAATDLVTEAGSEGTDKVKSAVSWTLGANLESLILTGTAAISGSGNSMASLLTGNAADNTLAGLDGNDVYDGAGGGDYVTDASLSSNDTYQWGIGSGLDHLNESGGALDHVDLFAGVTKAQLQFGRSGNNLELTINGQADKLTIDNWYVSTANQVEEFRLSDGSKVLASEVQSLLEAMSAFSAPPAATAHWAHVGDCQVRHGSNLTMPALR